MFQLLTDSIPDDGIGAPTAIFLTALLVVLSGVAIFFLYRSVRKERNHFIAEKLNAGELTKASFDQILERRFRIARRRTHFSIMYIEILNGESFRKSFGQRQYDAILGKLFERLYAIFPKGAKVGVYRENVLAVFLNEDLDRKGLSDMAAFCIGECIKPLTLITHAVISPELCIGAIAFDYTQKLTAARFRENVEYALLAAKRSGKNHYAVYSPELEFEEDEDYQFYRSVQAAVAAEEYGLTYQPVYDIASKKIFAYEGILHWSKPDCNKWENERFISLLEQSGDIQRQRRSARDRAVCTRTVHRRP